MQYPRILQTKKDYEFVRTHFPKEQWEKDFANLLNTTHEWFYVKQLSDDEVSQVKSINQKIELDDQGNKFLYEYKLNPKCKLLSIGYTEDEVLNILQGD